MKPLLAVVACSLLAFGIATATPYPGDESQGPVCEGRDLGITRRQVASDFAWAFCECGMAPDWAINCVPDMTEVILFSDGQRIICGEGVIELYDTCLELVESCVVGIPAHCWSLTGWDL